MSRIVITPRDLELSKLVRPSMEINDRFQLYKSLAVPSYVHGYGLCIEYYKRWFEAKFSHDYFRGGVYIDGKHVLDEYKTFKEVPVKRENPRARIIPTLDGDYDRDGIDTYLASPQVYLRRTTFQDSFFKDYDRKLFISFQMKAMKMNFNTKVRVNSRAEQLDLWNFMQLNFRNGATSYEYLSLDYHIPKEIVLYVAEKAGFEIVNNNIVDIIDFLNYFNQHSDIVLLFKVRAINKQPEFFLRVNNVYTHITCKDKLNRDDGEKDGKLDFNFGVEMENTIIMPVPAFYILGNQEPIMVDYKLEAHNTKELTALYSINIYEIPPVDENGWNQAAITSYAVDKDDEELDISSLFTGENILARTINLNLKTGVSPSKFINVKVFHNDDIAKEVSIKMNWEKRTAELTEGPAIQDEVYQIAVYYDREYIANIDTAINHYNDNRVSSYNQYHDPKTD